SGNRIHERYAYARNRTTRCKGPVAAWRRAHWSASMEERSGAEPDGQGRRLSRSANARAPNVMRSITRLIELRESADEQIATVASKALSELFWGKPQDYNPAAEQVQP